MVAELLAWCGAGLSCLLCLPQALRTLRLAERLDGISAGTYWVVLANAIVWVTWSLLTGEFAVGAPALVNGPAAVLILRRLAVSMPQGSTRAELRRAARYLPGERRVDEVARPRGDARRSSYRVWRGLVCGCLRIDGAGSAAAAWARNNVSMTVGAPLPPDLETPCLIVDREALEGNLSAMASHAGNHGVGLRPHAKTHKCVEIARRQLALGAVGLTVATVGEAEVFADAGVSDVFIAYPLWAVGARAGRLRALAERVALRVGADSAAGVDVLARALAGTETEVVVEVDSGHHRTGVAPAAAGQVAVAARRHGLRVAGVFTFPGHSYHPNQRERAAADEAQALQQAEAALRAAGVASGLRSGGSTPTAALLSYGALNEMRPGVYAFCDAQQVELGAVGWESVALTAAATVVSRRGRNLVLDAGSKVLGADRPSWTTGYGRLLDHPEARVIALSEHHATVAFPATAPLPELGSLVRVVPNHVCAAVNLTDLLVVISDGAVVDQWLVAARGRNA